MIDITAWMNEFLQKLNHTFENRVWFVGLQGSFARGEATETSDIDIVVILDELSAMDIQTYNKMLNIRADMQRKGYAKEAAIAVRDWTFMNTPFNIVYSYMKYTNEASVKTAISYGCIQVDEFTDDINEITKVFAISRDEWTNR